MATSLYRQPNEAIFDGMVTNARVFPPELSGKVHKVAMETGDVLIVSYPKSGTTWMQELTYLVNHEADGDKAMSILLSTRSRFLEMQEPGRLAGVDAIPNDPHPWVMKSHLPVRCFSKQLEERKVKVIVVMRNPMDTLVSYYHFYQNHGVFGRSPGTWNEFFQLIQAKRLLYGDIFEWNAGWWSQRDNKNVLIVKFEDMKKDIRDVIRQVALHCSKTFDAAGIDKIAHQVSLETMRNNPTINQDLMENLSIKVTKLIREGKVGGWRRYFSSEQEAYIEKRCEEAY